jgi:hypothetical protein
MTMTAVDPVPVTWGKPKRVKLWLPLPLSVLWVLLAPFAMVLSLFAWAAPPRYRVNGPRAAIAIGATLFALSGTLIEVRCDEADIFILIF